MFAEKKKLYCFETLGKNVKYFSMQGQKKE